jgi:predicted phosphodiesterase
VRLAATIESVDASSVQHLVGQSRPLVAMQQEATSGLGGLVRAMVLRALLAALLAGIVVGALVPWRTWRTVAAGASSGVLAVALLLGLTWRQFSTDALGRPQYQGVIEQAPQVIDLLQKGAASYHGAQDRLDALSERIGELATAATTTSAEDQAGEVRILHVSDIHLNPLGLLLAGDLAKRFAVAGIVDTGDLTSFGYAEEANIGAMVSALGVPYFLVPGNHDSFANRAALAHYRGLTVVDGEMFTIGGVRFAGFADPNFTVDGQPTYDENVAARLAESPTIDAFVKKEHPDVLAVAGLQQGEAAAGDVPLVISGDIHKRSSKAEKGTLFLTVGSTGATGLGSFLEHDDRPYEAEVFHFRNGALTAIDYVTLNGLSGNFTVDRTTYPAK